MGVLGCVKRVRPRVLDVCSRSVRAAGSVSVSLPVLTTTKKRPPAASSSSSSSCSPSVPASSHPRSLHARQKGELCNLVLPCFSVISQRLRTYCCTYTLHFHHSLLFGICSAPTVVLKCLQSVRCVPVTLKSIMIRVEAGLLWG